MTSFPAMSVGAVLVSYYWKDSRFLLVLSEYTSVDSEAANVSYFLHIGIYINTPLPLSFSPLLSKASLNVKLQR